MKLHYIITKCAFILISAVITTGIKAQEPDPAIIKMMPAIPVEITEPMQRAEYLSMHFWDKFDFSDASFFMNNSLPERCFVDFLDLLSIVPAGTRDKSIDILLKKSEASKSVFSFILKLSERYLYEPESPVYDEEKLIPFVQYALQSTILDDTEKIRPRFLLENISINRLGSVASDFDYILMNGEKGNLHSVNAEHTLLYFNDPDCEDCAMLIKQLIASTTISNLINRGKLKTIMTYVNDDIEAWEKHASEIPDTWIYTREAEQKIIIEGIYNIKQFPTIYLLDKDKKVLLKDTTFENLESYFRNF